MEVTIGVLLIIFLIVLIIKLIADFVFKATQRLQTKVLLKFLYGVTDGLLKATENKKSEE